ncbi:hypothetical protein ACFP3U_10185 [Kitasatospora misakiensis]|uniref:Uncharacterized protein n=1 Tax=Kitasatospora misakiensis TaxID=67330 RepID=A0ABW0X2F1_9ACTN
MTDWLNDEGEVDEEDEEDEEEEEEDMGMRLWVSPNRGRGGRSRGDRQERGAE